VARKSLALAGFGSVGSAVYYRQEVDMMVSKWLGMCVWFAFMTGCMRGCTHNHGEMHAEEVLEAYLTLAFNMEKVEQKQLLMEYAGNTLKAAIAGASDETIRTAYINKRYDLKRFHIVHRHDLTPQESELLFQLDYAELPEGATDFSQAPLIQVESKVLMMRETTGWVVQSIVSNKTDMDFPAGPLSQITVSKGPGLAP
jgi:hypothetical protein